VFAFKALLGIRRIKVERDIVEYFRFSLIIPLPARPPNGMILRAGSGHVMQCNLLCKEAHRDGKASALADGEFTSVN